MRLLPDSIVQPYIGGGAIQAGLDYFFYRNWLFNLDVKYVWIHAKARLHGDVNGNVHVNINPLVFGFGFGRKW